MLEIIPAEAAVIVCAAEKPILDRCAGAPERLLLRVAADELWLVGPRADRRVLLAAGQALVLDRGLVVDQTDGWWVCSAGGSDRGEVLRRLMVAPIPSGSPVLVQGAITGIPAKVVCEAARIHVFVPAGVGHHLLDRIVAVTGDLDVTISQPAGLTIDGGGNSC